MPITNRVIIVAAAILMLVAVTEPREIPTSDVPEAVVTNLHD